MRSEDDDGNPIACPTCRQWPCRCTSQPPQDEVKEVARTIGAVLLTGSISLTAAHINSPELMSRMAATAIATLDRLRRAAPAAEWSFDMDAAPKDKWLWVWCPAVEGLAPLLSLCLWHPDAGFCVDEIRTPVCWTRVQQPALPIPKDKRDDNG